MKSSQDRLSAPNPDDIDNNSDTENNVPPQIETPKIIVTEPTNPAHQSCNNHINDYNSLFPTRYTEWTQKRKQMGFCSDEHGEKDYALAMANHIRKKLITSCPPLPIPERSADINKLLNKPCHTSVANNSSFPARLALSSILPADDTDDVEIESENIFYDDDDRSGAIMQQSNDLTPTSPASQCSHRTEVFPHYENSGRASMNDVDGLTSAQVFQFSDDENILDEPFTPRCDDDAFDKTTYQSTSFVDEDDDSFTNQSSRMQLTTAVESSFASVLASGTSSAFTNQPNNQIDHGHKGDNNNSELSKKNADEEQTQNENNFIPASAKTKEKETTCCGIGFFDRLFSSNKQSRTENHQSLKYGAKSF